MDSRQRAYFAAIRELVSVSELSRLGPELDVEKTEGKDKEAKDQDAEEGRARGQSRRRTTTAGRKSQRTKSSSSSSQSVHISSTHFQIFLS